MLESDVIPNTHAENKPKSHDRNTRIKLGILSTLAFTLVLETFWAAEAPLPLDWKVMLALLDIALFTPVGYVSADAAISGRVL